LVKCFEANMNEILSEELDVVRAILMDGIDVWDDSEGGITTIIISLHPLTANEDERSFVSLALEIAISAGYPDVAPDVTILRPRGLLDSNVDALLRRLCERRDEYLGSLVIFELIDMCREFLTENNKPASKCAICLLDIVDADSFVKTVCYHYFHSCCLGQYVRSAIEEHEEELRENPAIPGRTEDRRLVIMCAVCREPIEDVRLQAWTSAPRPHLEASLEDFKMTPELERLQKKMKKLYLRQKERGSLIDVEAENKKYLVSTSSASTEAETSMNRNVLKNVAEPRSKSETHEAVAHSQEGASSKKKGRNRHSKKPPSTQDSVVEDQLDQEQPTGGGRQKGGRGRGRGHHRYQNQKGSRKSEGYKGNSEEAKSERS